MTKIIEARLLYLHIAVEMKSAGSLLRGLTMAISLLAATASAGGLLIAELYRDSELIRTAWLANDAVTLLISPALLISFRQYAQGSLGGRLWWLGLLLYLFYNYAFYLFGATFNWFFLIYAAVVTLSLYALILGLFEFHTDAITTTNIRHRKWVAGFLIMMALPLAIIEISTCIRFIVLGKEPDIPVLVLALDLTLVVPNTLVAAVLLWRKHQWGMILGAMMLVKAFVYGAVLLAGTISIATSGAGPWDPLLPFYIFVFTGGVVCLLMLLKDANPAGYYNLQR